MKIEFEIEDYNLFLTAINHAIIAYGEAIYKPMFFGLSNELPGKFYKAWKEDRKLEDEEIREINDKDMEILKNFYSKIEELNK